jgi:hypothetical protein
MRRLVSAVVAAILLAVPLRATTTIPTDLADVVSLSTLIVRGRVADTRSFTEIANGPVMTAVTVTVDDVVKGTADRSVTFRVYGGEMGRYRYTVIGSPTFAVGDEAYFFLKRAPAGALWPVGMSAGVYRVTDVVNAPVIAGVTATAGAPVQRGDVRRRPMAPAEFGSLVRMLMNTSTTAALANGQPSHGKIGKRK